jgi:hypothetical protein
MVDRTNPPSQFTSGQPSGTDLVVTAPCRCVYVETGGTFKFDTPLTTAYTMTLADTSWNPISDVTKVYLVGTTCTGITLGA